MTHITTLAFILMFVAVAVSKKYEGKDSKLMPASTPEGMRARIILFPIIFIGIAALVVSYAHPADYMHSPLWIAVSVITAAVPIISYVKFRNSKK